tara:strand:- start:958 stop:1278 length:321 start_codon:yes stop_codon:yes gene_type:complete
MQVIRIRYLGATATRGDRIKAFGEVAYGYPNRNASITESRDYEINPADQAKRLAIRFCNEWYPGQVVAAFGELPGNDPDWVATLENRYVNTRGDKRPMTLSADSLI